MRNHHTIHADQRAWQRYGVHPTPDQWRKAVLDIIEVVGYQGASALLLQRFDATERWIVRVAGHLMTVVYAPSTAIIITALTPEPNIS